jgi:hypothetical protein
LEELAIAFQGIKADLKELKRRGTTRAEDKKQERWKGKNTHRRTQMMK